MSEKPKSTPPAKERLRAYFEWPRKRLAQAVLAALLLHLPFTPAMPLVRLLGRGFAMRTDSTTPREQPPQLIEVELRDFARRQDEKREEQKRRAEAETRNSVSLQTPSPPQAPPPQSQRPSDVKFAQAKAQADDKSGEQDSASEKKKREHRDVGLEGKLSKDLAGKPMVSVGLWFSSFREHPLAATVRDLLACDSQWNAFFQQGVDPLRDFEAVLVVGTTLMEASKMTGAVRHAMAPDRVQSIMQTFVQRSGGQGQWITERVAKVKVGKGTRVLFPHSSDLFFVAPPDGWKALQDVAEPLRVPSSDGRAMSLVIRQPGETLARIGAKLPSRIDEMRLEVSPNSDGSFDVDLDLDDASEEAALADAKRVSEQLRDLLSDLWTTTEFAKRLVGISQPTGAGEPAPDLRFSTEGKTLTGTVHITSGQAATTLRLVASLFCRKKPGSSPPAKVARPPAAPISSAPSPI